MGKQILNQPALVLTCHIQIVTLWCCPIPYLWYPVFVAQMIFACFILAMVQPEKGSNIWSCWWYSSCLACIIVGTKVICKTAKLGHWVSSFWKEALATLHDRYCLPRNTLFWLLMRICHIIGRYYINLGYSQLLLYYQEKDTLVWFWCIGACWLKVSPLWRLVWSITSFALLCPLPSLIITIHDDMTCILVSLWPAISSSLHLMYRLGINFLFYLWTAYASQDAQFASWLPKK